MNDKSLRFVFWTVIIISAITLLPFLGNTDFTTKGEPREAVVAVSMLNQHNWILPINNGFDIPYKPPFFQWCIAALSMIAGHVSEFTSRLPSALSLIVMLCVGALFYAKRKNNTIGLLSAMLTLTAFEVHRAGTNCRVDMVLTMFIVCALYALYEWWERGCRRLPWIAVLCMSGATLTKGPVGMVLPCFVMFVFMLFTTWQGSKLNGAISNMNKVLGAVVNAVRSIPFVILMVAIIPLTRLIVGSSIGTTAAMVPLVLASVPFIGRQVETSLREIPEGIVEAAQSMGATPMQIISRVLLPEAMPNIVAQLTTVVISLVGESAMAGAIGGGGLGDLAIRYGYQRFRPDIMIATVVVLIVMVQVVQFAGNALAKKLDKR